MVRMSKGKTAAIIALFACVGCAPTKAPASPQRGPTPPDTDTDAAAAPPGTEPAEPPEASPPPRTGPGESKATAIAVCMPEGERAYLARLRCPDGAPPAHRRAGSVGSRTPMTGDADGARAAEQVSTGRPLEPGEPDFHVVDRYEVTCDESTRSVFLDMYHCGEPAPHIAPPGLSLAPAGSATADE